MALAEPTAKQDQIFEWSKALEIGHADIDVQHGKLFGYLKELKDSAEHSKTIDSVAITIDRLNDYASKHFSYEEYYMDEAAYDERDSHKAAHRVFVKKINQLKHEPPHQEAYDALIDFIYEWLITHINGTDRVMVAKMSGRHQGAFFGKSDAAQTSSIIDNAFKLAGLIERTSSRISSTCLMPKRGKHARSLSDSFSGILRRPWCRSGTPLSDRFSGAFHC